jgi:hypothetical protein
MTPRLTRAIGLSSGVWEHLANSRNVDVRNVLGGAELTLSLRALLGQDMAQMRLAALESTIGFRAESLGSTAIGFEFRH